MELKRVLIISPYFPPINAADMQRVRMSLPYFSEFGWEAEIVTVEPRYADFPQDKLLLFSVPEHIKVHQVKALSKNRTSRFGLGSIALRALWYYRQKVNQLLKESVFDLIYFSTTQFPVCILGPYWKKRFGVPYVIDMQDPWHSEYYQDKPKDQRPPKYWFSYRLNKCLERIAMRKVGGLISVSQSYIDDLKKRYPVIKNVPAAVIMFGAFTKDLEIAEMNAPQFRPLLDPKFTNLVYIGRGGKDMHQAISVLFRGLRAGLEKEPEIFQNIRIYFIGTSYAPEGQGKPTVLPLAKQYGVENQITETTDRISYYHSLITLQQADALFIPGSDDPKYTASKIYLTLQLKKPLLAIFNPMSPALAVFKEYNASFTYAYHVPEEIAPRVYEFLKRVVGGTIGSPEYNIAAIKKYAAESLTKRQCDLFEELLNNQ